MTFKFATDSIREAVLEFGKHSLPHIYKEETPLQYSARRGEIVGEQKGYNSHMKSHELALLTIKENGSVHEGYKSVSDAVPFTVGMHIGAICNNECLIVSDITENGELTHPAKLNLQDIIGYETLKKFE